METFPQQIQARYLVNIDFTVMLREIQPNTAWGNPLEIPYFEAKTTQKQGVWEYDIHSHQLHWSAEQFRLYGYEPNEFSLNDDFFIVRTTHNSEVKRISKIIENAIKNEDHYNFKRRIIRKNDSIGFVETQAIIIRSQKGTAKKILGTTIDLEGINPTEAFEYNDPRFFNQLYQNYSRIIKRQIFLIVGDEEAANDLCQEVFLKAWHNMSQYVKEKGELYTWLVNIARNHCKDYFRSKYYRSQQHTSSLQSEIFDAGENESFDTERMYVRDLLFKLPLCQREVIELLFVQGYSQSEIANLRNLPLGTIKSRSRAALKTLRKLIEAREKSTNFSALSD